MSRLLIVNIEHEHPETGEAKGSRSNFTLPWRARLRPRKIKSPIGLVASSDGEVLQKLSKIMGQCGLASFLAFGVGESRKILAREKVCVVLCDERLADGNFEDILSASEWSKAKAPVIVFSTTGDWPEYIRAIRAGAFDYIAYPPFLEETQRVIRSALASRAANRVRGTTTRFNS